MLKSSSQFTFFEAVVFKCLPSSLALNLELENILGYRTNLTNRFKKAKKFIQQSKLIIFYNGLKKLS